MFIAPEVGLELIEIIIENMARYKVEYINSEKIKSKWFQSTTTHVDAWTLAKELEALLLEYEKRNYKVLTIQPIVTPVSTGNGAGAKTDGLMVVFEKETAV